MPVSTGDLLGPNTVNREMFIEGIYTNFAKSSCRRSSEYITLTGNKRTSVQVPRGVVPMSRQVTVSSGPMVRTDIYGTQHLVDQET